MDRQTNAKKLMWGIYGFLIICFMFIAIQLVTKFELPVQTDGIAVLNQKNRGYETFEDIPNNLTQAMISIEDKRFRYHPGIDLIAFVRATFQTIRHNTIQGGSTIDQQLIKISSKNYKRNVRNKLHERRWATNLQFHYSKKDILRAYINNIPFSHDIRGRKAACDIYLHKSCDLLSDVELSYLMTLLQLGLNPYKQSNQEKIIIRATSLCSRLATVGITTKEGCDLLSNGVKIDHYEPALEPRVEVFLSASNPVSQTAFDLNLYRRINGILGTTKTLRDEYNVKDCCIVVLNATGDLISMNMCSSRDDDEAGRINLCTKPRQTGSAIKPFLYTFAFRKLGLTPEDTVVDEPVQYDLGDGSIYEPKNFDLTYHGTVTLAYALGNSLNIPAIKLADKSGVSSFLDFLKQQLQYFAPDLDNNKKLSDNVGLSVALGTYEISPYVFTQLWRLFLKRETPSEYQIQAQQVTQILSDPNNKVMSFGQDSFLNTPGRAVKTGTSRKFIDGRVCGVNNSKGLTMCIRMGNYDNQAMKGASSEVGGYVWKVIAEGL